MNPFFYYLLKSIILTLREPIMDLVRFYAHMHRNYSIVNKILRRKIFKKNKLYIIPRFHPEQQKRTWTRRTLLNQKYWSSMLLDELFHINYSSLRPLSFRKSCREGICGSCAMSINGLNYLACIYKMYSTKLKFKIFPLSNMPIIKDLVVSFRLMYMQIKSIKPWIMNLSNNLEKIAISELKKEPIDFNHKGGLLQLKKGFLHTNTNFKQYENREFQKHTKKNPKLILYDSNIYFRIDVEYISPFSDYWENIDEYYKSLDFDDIRDYVEWEPKSKEYIHIYRHLTKLENVTEAKRIKQTKKSRNLLNNLYECILCACCLASCPSYWWNNDKYLGPAMLLQAFRWISDSRDNATYSRIQSLNSSFRLYSCHYILNCTKTCPKNLEPHKVVQHLKRILNNIPSLWKWQYSSEEGWKKSILPEKDFFDRKFLIEKHPSQLTNFLEVWEREWLKEQYFHMKQKGREMPDKWQTQS